MNEPDAWVKAREQLDALKGSKAQSNEPNLAYTNYMNSQWTNLSDQQ